MEVNSPFVVVLGGRVSCISRCSTLLHNAMQWLAVCCTELHCNIEATADMEKHSHFIVVLSRGVYIVLLR